MVMTLRRRTRRYNTLLSSNPSYATAVSQSARHGTVSSVLHLIIPGKRVRAKNQAKKNTSFRGADSAHFGTKPKFGPRPPNGVLASLRVSESRVEQNNRFHGESNPGLKIDSSRFEPRTSESYVLTNYTMEPWMQMENFGPFDLRFDRSAIVALRCLFASHS